MEERELMCENCRRRVPFGNYQMHVVHCKRNIQLCSLCGEAVLRSEEREHFKEYHAEINCVQCGQKTTRSEEGNHLANECGKRPIPCQYCEITLPRERMPEHQEFCGSRTEFCHKCSRYILIKDLQNHERSCDGSHASESSALPCEFCGSLISPENLDPHQRQCIEEREFEESQDLQIPVLVEGADGVFRDFTAASRNRDKRGPDERSPTGQRMPDHSDRIDSSSVSHDSAAKAQAEDNSIVALPCEICGELCASDKLMEHQEECSRERESSVDYRASGREERMNDWNESDLPHFRFSERPNRELDDSFDGFDMNFAIQGSPYDILANVFRDLEERRWPFEMMRDLWSRT